MKFVILKSIVPATFDAGFRAAGYEVLELVETDEPVDLKAGVLERAIAETKKKVAVQHIISGGKNR